MQDADLYLSLAEIAGVFVGFGALIAVRSSGVSEAQDVAPMRGVVITGMMTIIAAVAPVTFGRYDLTDHQVWTLSSILVLIGYSGLAFIHMRAPEYKEAAGVLARQSRRPVAVVEGAASVLVIGGPLLALVMIALGVAAELEAALYFTVVVLFLVQAAWILLWRVFARRGPAGA